MPTKCDSCRHKTESDMGLLGTAVRCSNPTILKLAYETKMSVADMPLTYAREICDKEGDGIFACNNIAERGHRREYKRQYLKNWRKNNPELNNSYWKGDAQVREAARVRAATRSQADKDAIAIQRRLRTQGESVTIAEARELLAKYGRCYPSRYGLTDLGLRRCEQIRSRLRNRKGKRASFGYQMLSSFEIRVMVCEESEGEKGLVIPPDQQPVPYQKAAENLRRYHRNQRILEAI